jgi:hypothetical protein
VVTAVCLQGARITYKTTALELAIGLIHGPVFGNKELGIGRGGQ